MQRLLSALLPVLKPVKTRQDKTRQDKTKQDKTRQDKTRQNKTRQDKTRQNRPGYKIRYDLRGDVVMEHDVVKQKNINEGTFDSYGMVLDI